jgi:hypothetical protein
LLLLLLLGFICEGALGYGWVSVVSFSFHHTCSSFLPADDLSSSEGVGLLWLLTYW